MPWQNGGSWRSDCFSSPADDRWMSVRSPLVVPRCEDGAIYKRAQELHNLAGIDNLHRWLVVCHGRLCAIHPIDLEHRACAETDVAATCRCSQHAARVYKITSFTVP